MPHWIVSLDETLVVNAATRRRYVAEDTVATSWCTEKHCHIYRDNGDSNSNCPRLCETSRRKDGRRITWIRKE